MCYLEHRLRRPSCWWYLFERLQPQPVLYLSTEKSAEQALRSGRAALAGKLRRALGSRPPLVAAL